MILSKEGSQKWDVLNLRKFCESIQLVINKSDFDIEIGFMDDISLSSDILTLEKDIKKIIESEASKGLKLNAEM